MSCTNKQATFKIETLTRREQKDEPPTKYVSALLPAEFRQAMKALSADRDRPSLAKNLLELRSIDFSDRCNQPPPVLFFDLNNDIQIRADLRIGKLDG